MEDTRKIVRDIMTKKLVTSALRYLNTGTNKSYPFWKRYRWNYPKKYKELFK
jgi:hypothetical protein